MKQYLKRIMNPIKYLLSKDKVKNELGYRDSNRIILLGSDGGLFDEDICWDIIQSQPQKLMLVGARNDQLKRMEREVSLVYPKLLIG